MEIAIPFKFSLIQPLAVACLASALAVPLMAQIDIPYEKFVLDNGLTLLVHEDRKAPIVSVNVWYHVGSKNEKPGKTGFAHLFEHLMFNGSEHFNDDYFQAMERVGATNLNGTTNQDRTNYFQNVPKPALDLALWMESDRMGHMLGAVDQAKLDEQRGVVQNEKRQGENQPYAIGYELMTKGTYPHGHPYSWTVIGEMEDLDAASLDDVHEWFKTYYGAANAVISIAGDISPDEAHERVKKYFGSIPGRPSGGAAQRMDRAAHGRTAPDCRGSRPASSRDEGLEHSTVVHARVDVVGYRQRRARQWQEFEAVQAPGLRGSDRDQRDRIRVCP